MNQLHADAIVADCHNDIAQMLVRRHQLGGLGSLKDHWLPELRAGGINVQVMPVSAEGSMEVSLRHTLQQIAAVRREIGENPDDVELCLDGPAIRAAVGRGRIAMVLAMEGASALGDDPGLVQLFHALGVRVLSLTHFGRNWLGDGSAEDATGSRLSAAGIATLAEMERLGMIFDVTHLGKSGVSHILELATRPVIATHSVARAINDHHRNLADEHLAGVAATGGIVCANGVPGFIDPNRPTIDRMLDHVEHMIEIAGVEHVGIGLDFCVEMFELIYPPAMELMIEGIDARQKLEGLWGARQMPALTEAMQRRGFSEAQIRGILGENLLRVFDCELGVPGKGMSAGYVRAAALR
ncbi:MAG: dipeptidase [Candidatus Dormibacteria bacterium]